jgi:thiol-disulfide isomerase/thioredoxin
MKSKFLLLVLLLASCAAGNLRASNLGDPAPAVFVERWVKGSPVRIAPGTNIFVVEFWATWCPPCRKAIPHLTELQWKYADQGVVIIAFSKEKVETVQPFVAAQGAAMNYNVVVDSSGRTFKNWMTAYGEGGIPHAFIVGKDGTVLWHGFPSDELDRTLERILAGTYNLERAQNFQAGNRLLKLYTTQVYKSNAGTNATALGEKILTEFTQDWRVANRLARAILTDPKVRSREVPLALRAATQAVEMTKRRSADALEMLARAQYASGSRAEAIITIKEAIAVETDPADKTEYEGLLAMYERGLKAEAAGKK